MRSFEERAYAELFDEFLRDQDGVLEDAVQGALAEPAMSLIRELSKPSQDNGLHGRNGALFAILIWRKALHREAEEYAKRNWSRRVRQMEEDEQERQNERRRDDRENA